MNFASRVNCWIRQMFVFLGPHSWHLAWCLMHNKWSVGIAWETVSPIELLCFPPAFISFLNLGFSSGSTWTEPHCRVLETSWTHCRWLLLPFHLWHVWEVSRCLWDSKLECPRYFITCFCRRNIPKQEWSLGTFGMKALGIITSPGKDWI